MKNMFISTINILVVVYICLCLLLYVMQRQLIYMPTPSPGNLSIDSEFIQSEQEQIKVLNLNKDKPNAILYFGGNAEDVSGNIESFKNIFDTSTIYLVNYRGYSGSTGSPSERANYADALNIYDHVRSKHASISIIGRSLGGGIATYVAVKREVDKLVLVAPFDSVEQIAKQIYPIFPVSIMLKDKYDSYSRAHLIEAKTLVIIAEHDEIIPRKNSDRLVSRLNKQHTKVSIIPDATHNAIDANGDYSRLLAEYFE